MEDIPIIDLYEEVLAIYDNDTLAISFHIAFLLKKIKRKKESLTSINEDINEQKSLEKYRNQFIKICDTFKDEIEEFRQASKFQIKGTPAIYEGFLHITTDENLLSKFTKRELVERRTILSEISSMCQVINHNLEKEINTRLLEVENE